jgi:hypothetical protein
MASRAFALTGMLVALFVAAGCADHSRLSTPHVRSVPPSPLERKWLGSRSTQPPSRRAKTPKRITRAVALAAHNGGVQLVDVTTYRMPSRSPAITLAVSEPASFLRHGLDPIVRATVPYNEAYIRIVDAAGGRILEWYKTGTGGALYVRPGLEGCSPIMAYGWGHVAQCPAR